MRIMYFLLTVISALQVSAQTDAEVYKKSLDYVVMDVSGRLTKKQKLYFSKVILSNGVSGMRPLYGISFTVDTTGFQTSNQGLSNVEVDSVDFINYENKNVNFKKKRKNSYEIKLFLILRYNENASFLKITVSSPKSGVYYIYNLFIQGEKMDVVMDTYLE